MEKSAFDFSEDAKNACQTGNLEKLQTAIDNLYAKLSMDTDLPLTVQVMGFTSGLLTEACYHNHLHIVKWLLTNDKIKNLVTIDEHGGNPLEYAVERNHIEIVTYLLTSPDLTQHADVHLSYDKVFTKACSKGNVEMVKLLLECDKLQPYANDSEKIIKEKLELGFLEAFDKKQSELLEYFLFELKLQPGDSMNKYLNLFDEEKIEKLFGYFENRDLHEKLHSLLPTKVLAKKKKI